MLINVSFHNVLRSRLQGDKRPGNNQNENTILWFKMCNVMKDHLIRRSRRYANSQCAIFSTAERGREREKVGLQQNNPVLLLYSTQGGSVDSSSDHTSGSSMATPPPIFLSCDNALVSSLWSHLLAPGSAPPWRTWSAMLLLFNELPARLSRLPVPPVRPTRAWIIDYVKNIDEKKGGELFM